MSTYNINLTIDDNFQKVLDYFKSRFPLLSEVEIVKMAVGGFYAQNKAIDNQLWMDSLPNLKLTDTQMNELEKGIEQFESSDKIKFSTGEDFVKYLNLAD